MSYSFRRTNPKLAGSIVEEKVYCGKKNCHCAKDKHPHGSYFYLYYRDYDDRKRLKKQYIPRDEVQALREKMKVAKADDRAEMLLLRKYFHYVLWHY